MIIDRIVFIIIAIMYVVNTLDKSENTRDWDVLQTLILIQILGILL